MRPLGDQKQFGFDFRESAWAGVGIHGPLTNLSRQSFPQLKVLFGELCRAILKLMKGEIVQDGGGGSEGGGGDSEGDGGDSESDGNEDSSVRGDGLSMGVAEGVVNVLRQ